MNRWLRSWFEPSSPVNRGVCRILFFGGLLLFYAHEDFSAWGGVSPGRAEPPASRQSGEYTWPIRMGWVAMSLVFFAAGIAKLRYGGIAWVTSDNMRILLLRAAYHVSDANPLTRGGSGSLRTRGSAAALPASR